MSQGEEEIIIIGGGKRPKALAVPWPETPWPETDSVYDQARAMIDRAEAEELDVRFEKKAAKE